MTYDFFMEHFDLEEYEVKAITVKNNKLSILVIMPIHLELIANGYRPELDMTQTKTFVFNVASADMDYSTKSKVLFKEDSIIIGDNELKINDFMVDIK